MPERSVNDAKVSHFHIRLSLRNNVKRAMRTHIGKDGKITDQYSNESIQHVRKNKCLSLVFSVQLVRPVFACVQMPC